MRKNAFKLFFFLVVGASCALFANAQTISVSGSIEKSSVKRGTTGKGSLVLSIPAELHINSSKPTSEYMIPTKIGLSSREVKNIKFRYPKGKDIKFDFSEEAINVYDGKTIIKFSFTVPKTLKPKTVKIRALVSYQACTNELCYPPQKTGIFLTAKVL